MAAVTSPLKFNNQPDHQGYDGSNVVVSRDNQNRSSLDFAFRMLPSDTRGSDLTALCPYPGVLHCPKGPLKVS